MKEIKTEELRKNRKKEYKVSMRIIREDKQYDSVMWIHDSSKETLVSIIDSLDKEIQKLIVDNY